MVCIHLCLPLPAPIYFWSVNNLYLCFLINMAFQLRPNEKVLLIQRRHWFTIFIEFLWIILLAVLVPVSIFWLQFSFEPLAALFADWTLVLLLVMYYQLILIISFTFLADYYLDIWVITDQRLIKIELKGFFNRLVTTINLDRIQDIKVSTRGFFATLFTYGDIKVQTAGTEADFVFFHTPKPQQTKTIIYKALKEKSVRNTLKPLTK